MSINYKLLFIWVALIGIFYFSLENSESIKILIDKILSWKHLSVAYWLLIISCYFIKVLSNTKASSPQSTLIYKNFGKFADISFTVITLGLAGTTSLALLKGVFGQMIIKNNIYFMNFEDIDIWSLLVVSIFLLIYSLKISLSTLYYSIINKTAVKVEPVSE